MVIQRVDNFLLPSIDICNVYKNLYSDSSPLFFFCNHMIIWIYFISYFYLYIEL